MYDVQICVENISIYVHPGTIVQTVRIYPQCPSSNIQMLTQTQFRDIHVRKLLYQSFANISTQTYNKNERKMLVHH